MPANPGENVQVFLLGTFELHVNGRLVRLPTRKSEALFAYLLWHRSAQHREKLAALFWGDSPAELARRSLRTALSTIRKAVGETALQTDRETVQLHPQFQIWVDVAVLQTQAEAVLAGESGGLDTGLYRGDLLQDFYDDWILEAREQTRQLWLRAVLHLARARKSAGDYLQAQTLAEKIISLDPIHEPAYQILIFCQTALGQRSEALRSYEALRPRLLEQLGITPATETTALFEQARRDGQVAAPAAKSNLPVPLTSFIGREQALVTLTEIFRSTRLLTLTGVGGCGKTRLAIQFAAKLEAAFPEGIWWVELATLQDETVLAATIQKVLGLTDSPDSRALDSLFKYLQARHLLLVLDNCEHLIGACATLVDQLLNQCPDLRILATSREALSIHGELAWLVPSLSLPAADSTEDLLQWEGPRLFMERAAAYRSDLQLTEANAAAVLRICRALEGIPLAVELAAARVKTLSLEQLAERLDDRLSLLTTGSRAAQPRQKTLRATLDWSYELLSEPEKTTLQRLAVFYGTWTLEAAEYVCGRTDLPTAQVLDLIARLLDKSLLVADHRADETRYRMLEIVRQYALEKLDQAGELERSRDRHTRYFAELAQRAEPNWYTRAQTGLLRQFQRHAPNLRVALAWGLEAPQRAANWANGLQLALALVPFWNFEAEFYESQSWLARVTQQIDSALAAPNPSLDRRELLFIKGRAVYETAALSYYLTHHAARIDLFKQAAEIFRDLGDGTGLARANLYMARNAADQGQNERALQIWLESLAQFQQVGDRWYAAMTHSFLGTSDRWAGKYAEAERHFNRAIELYSELGDDWGKSIMLSHLGMVALARGKPAKARALFESRLHTAQRVGFRFSQAYSTFLIGLTYWQAGELAEMEACFRAAIPNLYEIGNYATLSDCLIGLAWVTLVAGQPERAAYLLGAVERINQTFGRKVYFEFEFFNQPLCKAVRSRLDPAYAGTIDSGFHASLDTLVKELIGS